MNLRKFLGAILAYAIVVSCLVVPAHGSENSDERVISQKDLSYEWVDLTQVKFWEDSAMPLTTASFNQSIPAHSICTVSPQLSFRAKHLVTFNCSYSPSSASMDFGVLTPDGRFYAIPVKGGSINQTLEISQAGNYSVAIRNNSSQTVSVVGFVEY